MSTAPEDAAYALQMRYADALYRINLETGECLCSDANGERHTVLTLGERVGAKRYLTAVN